MNANLLRTLSCTLFVAVLLGLTGALAEAATIVALGASNTYGKGVARNQSYPAQLEAILRARGLNDTRTGSPDVSAEIQSRLRARGIPVVMLHNEMLRGLPRQPDGRHLTPEGYRMVAQAIAPRVASVIGR